MTISEFIDVTEVTEIKDGSWEITVPLFNGEDLTFTINDCYSEYEAKERAFLYLTEKIEQINDEKETGKED